MILSRTLVTTLLALNVGLLFGVGNSPQAYARPFGRDTGWDWRCGDGGHGRHHRDAAARRLEYLEHFYRHFSGERAFALMAMLPEDMVWNVTGWRTNVVPFAGEYAGRWQISDLFHRYFAAIHIERYEFEYKLADGDYVNWHFRLVARVLATGKTFDMEFVHVWQFGDDGAPVACRTYYDTQMMVEAFTNGGPAHLVDLKNPEDDFAISATSYDVAGLVAQLYDFFYAGKISDVFAMIASTAYVYFQGKDNPQSGEYHGLAGVQQFVMNLAGTAVPYDIQRFYVTEGDRTDVVLFENWTVPATGKSYHVHTVNSWRVDAEGKLMGFINYPDIDEVAAAYVP